MKCSNPACAREIPVEVIFKIVKGNGVARCSCKTETVVPFPVVKAAVASCLDEGVKCPACDQFAKRYRRKLNSAISRWLIALVRLHGEGLDWVHVAWIAAVVGGESPTTAKTRPIGASPIGSGDYAKARYWSLIEDQPSDDESKKDSGFWRITGQGRAFVAGATSLHAKVILYNNAFEGFTGKRVTIKEALGSKFNFQDLMNGVGTNPD